MEGMGKLELKNGDVYEGEFANGKMEGRGVYTFANGIVHEGEFANGEKVKNYSEMAEKKNNLKSNLNNNPPTIKSSPPLTKNPPQAPARKVIGPHTKKLVESKTNVVSKSIIN
jgi:hypothetical protein